MGVFYNEWEPYPAQWLRSLIKAGHLPEGVVNEHSIQDVAPADCGAVSHFFAGIGGWPLALRLAGWPADLPVWTGSCPCQPFSAAGKHGGFSDDRHLWPEFFRLIRECRPPIIFGEQVASPDGLQWLDLVFSDLEGAGYAIGAADLCAASVGAPHRRQRLFFVAVGNARGAGAGGDCGTTPGTQAAIKCPRVVDGSVGDQSGAPSTARSVADAARVRREQQQQQSRIELEALHARTRDDARNGPWSSLEWLQCQDGKSRSTQPGLFPLAHGVPNRVGRLRAYGNAIVPQVAAVFIRAVMGIDL